MDNGHLRKGFKPVHWCLDCGSALAEAEVEYQDKTSPAIDVRFPAANAAEMAAEFGLVDNSLPVSVVIWTTTPWTLPANLAVSLHPELEYALVKLDNGQGDELVVLAEALVNAAMQRYGVENFEIVGRTAGQQPGTPAAAALFLQPSGAGDPG